MAANYLKVIDIVNDNRNVLLLSSNTNNNLVLLGQNNVSIIWAKWGNKQHIIAGFV